MNVRACYRLRSFKKLRGFILLLLGGSIVVDLARVVMDAVLPEPSGVKSAVVVREAGKQKKFQTLILNLNVSWDNLGMFLFKLFFRYLLVAFSFTIQYL